MEQHHSSDQGFFKMILEQYKNMSAAAVKQGKPDPGIPILTQSKLRLEQYITSTSTQITFPVLDGQVGQGSSSVLPNEIRLLTNDNFHIHKIGLYLAVTVNPTDTAFRLMTNPNEVFLGNAATALNYLNIWNATLKININQVDVLTNWPTERHFYVPQTQRLSAAVNNNFDQIQLLDDGMVACAPSLMLSGAYTNTITLNLNGAINLAVGGNNSRYVMMFYGLRAQNAAIRK
jgi:hypothetical protein